MQFARVDFGSLDVKPELRSKWQGKIVTVECGEGYSLEGHQDEGIILSAPKECFKPLTKGERRIAELLSQTFWDRTAYTEDKSILKKMIKK
jgi:hypothetical protein